MFNQNSFSIDSNKHINNSFGGYNSPKGPSNPANSFRNDEDDYDFGAMANYNFKDVGSVAQSLSNKPGSGQELDLKSEGNISKQEKSRKPTNFATHTGLQKITQKLSQNSLSSDDERPRGLLKQKMKVDYAFDHKKSGQSELAVPNNKNVYKSSTLSQVNTRSQLSAANLFSCMDAPEYQRDFEVSPKVIARKHY